MRVVIACFGIVAFVSAVVWIWEIMEEMDERIEELDHRIRTLERKSLETEQREE